MKENQKKQLNEIMNSNLLEAAAQATLGGIFEEINIPELNQATSLVNYIVEERSVPKEGVSLFSPLRFLHDEKIIDLVEQVFEKRKKDLLEFEKGLSQSIKKDLDIDS